METNFCSIKKEESLIRAPREKIIGFEPNYNYISNSKAHTKYISFNLLVVMRASNAIFEKIR